MTKDDVTKLAWRFVSEKKKIKDLHELEALSNVYSSMIPPELFHQFQEEVIDLQARTRKDLQ